MAERKRGRRLKQRADIWDHFTRETDGDGKEIARCKRCRKVYAYHGTKNLREHYDKGCVGQEEFFADAGAAEQQPHAPSRHGGSSERESSSGSLQEEASKHLARMIALGGYDASILEDHWFKSFVRSLNPEFELPSRVTIENMCDGIFDEEKRDLLDRLRHAPGKVNLELGKAKTMEEQVLYASCHFIDDGWNLHNLLLHATVTMQYIDDRYIDRYLVGPILGFDNRYIDYISLDIDTDELVSDYGIDGRLSDTNPSYLDNVLQPVALCLLPDEDFNEQVSFDIENLLLTRQERLELFAELDLHYGWAFDKHWYACYCSLQVLHKKGFPRQITDTELVTTKLLCKLWEKIYRIIQKISSSNHPTANLCLAELFKLREDLQLELALFSSGDHGYGKGQFLKDKDITGVLKDASNTLEKAIQDSYLDWSLPLALDPRYKLQFIEFIFKRAYGLEAATKYVSKVMTNITDLYTDYVKEYGTTDGAHRSDGAGGMDTATSADDTLEQEWNEHRRSQRAMTTQVISCYYPEAETELVRYLKDPLGSDHHPQAEGFDILHWWKLHSSEYPMVSRMARDVLAIPTCSKLSSDQMAKVRSILRGYSKKPYGSKPFPVDDDDEEEE